MWETALTIMVITICITVYQVVDLVSKSDERELKMRQDHELKEIEARKDK